MYLDLEPLQGKPWHQQIDALVRTADRIAKKYQNPLINDAGGTLDCYKLDDKLQDCIHILKRYNKEERP